MNPKPGVEKPGVEKPARSVLIADDHPLFRLGLKYALSARGFEVRAEAADGRAALEACRTGRFDVVLLDVKMPVMDGIEACREVRRLERAPLVIMLTTFEEPAIVAAAREAGATAYLSKETDPGALAELIEAICSAPGRSWLPRVELPDLTPREAQVLRLLAEGHSNKAIARALALSPETVKDYLNGIYRKLEVRDRLAAVNAARDLGLV